MFLKERLKGQANKGAGLSLIHIWRGWRPAAGYPGGISGGGTGRPDQSGGGDRSAPRAGQAADSSA